MSWNDFGQGTPDWEASLGTYDLAGMKVAITLAVVGANPRPDGTPAAVSPTGQR